MFFARRARLLEILDSILTESPAVLIEDFSAFTVILGKCEDDVLTYATATIISSFPACCTKLFSLDHMSPWSWRSVAKLYTNNWRYVSKEAATEKQVSTVHLLRRTKHFPDPLRSLGRINSMDVLGHSSVVVRFCVGRKDSGAVKVRLCDVTWACLLSVKLLISVHKLEKSVAFEANHSRLFSAICWGTASARMKFGWVRYLVSCNWITPQRRKNR